MRSGGGRIALLDCGEAGSASHGGQGREGGGALETLRCEQPAGYRREPEQAQEPQQPEQPNRRECREERGRQHHHGDVDRCSLIQRERSGTTDSITTASATNTSHVAQLSAIPTESHGSP
jgi:hypothetical protein